MELFRGSNQKDKKIKRIGRGGKRGTTSGRGTKGQKSRAGHRIRPAERDFLIRLPKKRGYKNKSLQIKPRILNVEDLNNLKEGVIDKKIVGNVKILGRGELKKVIAARGLKVSKSAKEKIEKAGGKID